MCLFPPFLCTIPAVVNPWDIIDYSMRNQTDLEKSVASISLRTSLLKDSFANRSGEEGFQNYY